MRDIHQVIDARAVTPAFQPLVSLESGEPVGFEVAAPPADLVAAARAAGRGAELDWTCRAVAYRAALDAGLDVTLVVPAEQAPCPPGLAAEIAGAERRLTVVKEVAVGGRGLRAAGLIRAAGHGVAVRDVASGPALLPLLRPDVITVDMALLRSPEDPSPARTLAAVGEYAEVSGAAIVVTGVVTDGDARLAWTAGATVVRGAGEALLRAGEKWLPRASAPDVADGSPYEIVSACRPVLETTRVALVSLGRRLESLAVDGQVLMARLPDVDAATRLRFDRVARLSPLALALDAGGPAGEWTVIVLGPHQATALVARELGGDRFGFVVTHDRALVVAAARALLARTPDQLVPS